MHLISADLYDTRFLRSHPFSRFIHDGIPHFLPFLASFPLRLEKTSDEDLSTVGFKSEEVFIGLMRTSVS